MIIDPVVSAIQSRLLENPEDDLARAALADRYEETGEESLAADVRKELLIPFRIRSYDWKEAFAYAVKPDECPPGTGIDRSGFTREDVAEVIAIDDGENDGQNWMGVFRLRDGRFAFLSAGCDYTGWD